ncbi:HTH-type transcriptional regulator LuxR [compost metagenome]
MNRENYHHGDLKQELIDKGLLLLNREGFEKFSLRKVASMCGVSHTAPYKHFKDKEELIEEIIKKVWKSFNIALSESTNKYKFSPKEEIIEMGKAYVKFMVENPEYLNFMFLWGNSTPIKIEENKFNSYEGSAFEVFKNSAERYLKEINIDESEYTERVLTMWSMVHGISILLAKGSIKYNGDYLDLTEKMIRSGLGI